MKIKLSELIREEIKGLSEGIDPKLIAAYKKWVKTYNDFHNDVEFADNPEKFLYYFNVKLNRLYWRESERQKIQSYLHKNVAPNPLAKFPTMTRYLK